MIKFCKKCQIETERYARGECKQCARVMAAEYRAANKDKVLASKALYRDLNKEKCAASGARYRSNNKGKINIAKAKRRAANPEKERLRRARWRKSHPEQCKIKKINRKARLKNVGGKLSQGLAGKLFKLQKGLCPCCKQQLGDDYHLDHIMPIALGGSNTDDNIQLLRSACNMQKSAKHPIKFMQSRGFLL